MLDMKIRAFEKSKDLFDIMGVDIVEYMNLKKDTDDHVTHYANYSGEYYKKPHECKVGNEKVYFKKCEPQYVHAEIILSRIYNKLGMDTPIVYPWYDKSKWPQTHQNQYRYHIVDGVVSKDVHEVCASAEHIFDMRYYTIKGLFKQFEDLNITQRARLKKIEELILSLVFNNKDAGYFNCFWGKSGANASQYDEFIPIDLGYAGRDSMYFGDAKEIKKNLYFKGEHGFNGWSNIEEDRATTILYLSRLLSGEEIDGVQFSPEDIKILFRLIDEIEKIDFAAVAESIKEDINWQMHPKFLSSLEISREDALTELQK